jgi:molybdate transport system permease protein
VKAADLLEPLALTLVLATATTLVLLVIGTPLAWWLARGRARWREFVAAVTALPLVLPPTVLGFYLLILLGPNGPGGVVAPLFGLRTLAFSFPGLVIGSVIYSLPFMVQPLRNAFAALDEHLMEAASTLGAVPIQQFLNVALPAARSGFITGTMLTFAHTVGEFGVVLMIGGNIPGRTRVMSIAIYNFVEQGEWGEAHVLAAGLVIFAFVVISAAMLLDRHLGRIAE